MACFFGGKICWKIIAYKSLLNLGCCLPCHSCNSVLNLLIKNFSLYYSSLIQSDFFLKIMYSFIKCISSKLQSFSSTCSSQTGSGQPEPYAQAHVCVPPEGRYHFSQEQTSAAVNVKYIYTYRVFTLKH